MASPARSISTPAFVDGLESYALLKGHAASCDACLGDALLAVVSLTVTGEVRFPLELCPRGEQLLAAISDDLWPDPVRRLSLSGSPATTPPGQGAVAPIPTPEEVTTH